MAPALSALAVGLMYEPRALGELEGLVTDFTHDEVAQLRMSAWRTGLKTTFRGAPLAKLAEQVVEIAMGGLERRALKDDKGSDERQYLAPLSRLVASAKTPAESMLEKIDTSKDLRPQVVALARL